MARGSDQMGSSRMYIVYIGLMGFYRVKTSMSVLYYANQD